MNSQSIGTVTAETWIMQRLHAVSPSTNVVMFPAPDQVVGITIRFIARGPTRRGSNGANEIFEEVIYEVAATSANETQYPLLTLLKAIKSLDRKYGLATDLSNVTIGTVLECLSEGPISYPYKADGGVTRQRSGFQFRIRTRGVGPETDVEPVEAINPGPP